MLNRALPMLLAGFATAATHGAAIADPTWPTRVSATYKVVVAGFELGTFSFTSTLNGSTYFLSGQTELTWGFGMFSWSSATRASGIVAGDHVDPAAYTFDYKSNTKAGSVKIGFVSGSVSNVSIVPPSPPLPGTIPLKEGHLKSVFDPMSALLAMSRGAAANPCGKQRFDLALSFRRQEQVKEVKPSGQPALVYVCRVQYIPVAGYQASKDTQTMAANNGIEVALRPIPSAHLLVPSRIVVPTSFGTSELIMQKVEITAPGNKTIGLTH